MNPFRQEALAHRERGQRVGQVLRVSPAWVRRSYVVLCTACAAAALFAAVAKMHQYAQGPAVVQVEGRTDLTAKSECIVATVAAQPGQRVKRGEILLRCYGAQEESELLRIEREFNLLLARTLRDPADQGARQALSALRAERELAAARRDERTLRAPHDGILRDVRIRPGQRLAAGDVALSLLGDSARFYVLALLPGQFRPLLRSGQPLRLELSGYRYSYYELQVTAIGDEVVGPQEVRRYLPREIADAVPLLEPVVLARAALPSAQFFVDGHPFRYHEGMLGSAEVRVRAESLLFTLLPALKKVRHAP